MMRLVAVQRCPVVPKAPEAAFDGEVEVGVVEHDHGFLPPSSSEQCLKLLAAVAPTILPTAEEPVSEMARTTGCSVSGVPTSCRSGDDVDDAFGMPASVSA